MNQDALIVLRKALSGSKAYTDTVAKKLAGGLRYKGSVANKNALPITNNELGHMYTTNDNGHEWVWTIDKSSGTLDNWLDLSKDLDDNYYKKGVVDSKLNLKANADEVVKLTGNQTIDGSKTFNDSIQVGNGSSTIVSYEGIKHGDGMIDGTLYKFPAIPGTESVDVASISYVDSGLANKQDSLTAGENITIDENNVISASSGSSYSAGNGVSINDNTISTKLGKGLKYTDDGEITIKPADTTISVGEFGVRVPYVSTSLDNTSSGLAVRLADNSIEAYNSGTGTKGIRVNTNVIQSKLTAGTNITINENNVISASSAVSFDEKTITKGTDNKYQTAVGGWKEDIPEQATELFIDTKGDGSPTWMSTEKYEVGWDYNTTITSLVSGATTATVHVKVTVLGTYFDSNVVLTKIQNLPVRWESDEFTIDENIYRIKFYDDYIGENQGGIGLISNKLSLDLSESVMSSCRLVVVPASVIYHPIDNKFLNLDSSLSIDGNTKLKVNTEAIQSKLTAGNNIAINNNIISATDTTYTAGTGIDITNNVISNKVSPLIPTQATSTNQLSDKAFVTDAVSTACANFRSTWSTYTAIPTDATQYPQDYSGSTTPTTNDYLVVQNANDYTTPLSGTWRFKYSGLWSSVGKAGWLPEYQISAEPLTTEQLAALNSGVTSSTVSQVASNTSAIIGKQDKLTAGSGINIDSNNVISVTATTIFNMIYPVGSYHFGVTAPTLGTWEKVEGDKAIWIKSSASDGTNISQSLPIPYINSTFTGTVSTTSSNGTHAHVTSSDGNHNHDRGDMNIQGVFNMFWENINTSGALYGERCDYENPMLDSSKNGTYRLGINAANNWTGHTNTTGSHNHTTDSQGAHAHTLTPEGTVATSVTADTIYKSGANVQPNAVVMTVWKRIA